MVAEKKTGVVVRKDWIKEGKVKALVMVRGDELIRRVDDDTGEVESEWFCPTLQDVMGQRAWQMMDEKDVPEVLLYRPS